MAQTEPHTEPTIVTAGDTLIWRRSFADYPAGSGWVLKYRLINAAGKYDITAGADGDEHRVSVAASTSAAYTAGDYVWTAWVEKGAERYTVGGAPITVKPNLAAVTAAGFDARSAAQQALEALKAALKTYVTTNGHVAEYEIAGRRMKFSSASEIEEKIRFWQREMASADKAERLAQGLPPRNRVLVSLR